MYDNPVWLRFNFLFTSNHIYTLTCDIKDFEAKHPFLTLVLTDDLDKVISVLGDPLFVDGKFLYRELLYKFKRFRHLRYYQPHPALEEWLSMIDEFSEYRKNK